MNGKILKAAGKTGWSRLCFMKVIAFGVKSHGQIPLCNDNQPQVSPFPYYK